jgi:hypothetical protein
MSWLRGLSSFSLSKRIFKDDVLASRGYIALFLISAILTVALTVLMRSKIDPAKTVFWIRLPLTLVAMVGTPALFFLWFGMWFYWARLDKAAVWVKRVWFVILLFGLWYGSILYCLLVYLPQVASKPKIKVRDFETEDQAPMITGGRVLVVSWFLVLVSMVVLTRFPRALMWIPYPVLLIRVLLPSFLIFSIVYGIYLLYRRGTKGARPR